MDDLEAYRMENKYPVYGVQSRENGLKYFYDDERRGIVISGMKGKLGALSGRQKPFAGSCPRFCGKLGWHCEQQKERQRGRAFPGQEA